MISEGYGYADAGGMNDEVTILEWFRLDAIGRSV
jgi:hypothetical protein